MNKESKIDVYLLDAHDSAGYPFIQALHESGRYVIHALVCGNVGVLGSSRLCDTIVLSNADFPAGSEQLFSEIFRGPRPKILVPLTTKATLWVAQNRTALERRWIVTPVSSPETIELANDKLRFAQWARGAKFPTPRTIGADEIGTQGDLGGLRFPVLLKPRSGKGGRGIQVFVSSAELLKRLESERSQGQGQTSGLIVQEYMQGRERSSGLFCQKGRILSSVIYEKITWHWRFGPFRSYRFIRDEETLALLASLAEELQLDGIANIDLCFNPDENRTYILEVNCRTFGSVRGPLSVGVNFPDALCRVALGEAGVSHHATSGMVIQNLDLFWLAPLRLCQGATIAELWRETSLRFLVRDPIPHLRQALQTVARVLMSAHRGSVSVGGG